MECSLSYCYVLKDLYTTLNIDKHSLAIITAKICQVGSENVLEKVFRLYLEGPKVEKNAHNYAILY